MIYYPDLDTEIEIWVVYRFLAHKMTSNGKSLNYKVKELVESYNCHINFISIRVHTKKLRFFKNELNHTAVGYDSWRCYSSTVHKHRTTRWLEHYSTSNRRMVWRLGPTAFRYGGSCMVLQNLKPVIYFLEKSKDIT
jgi:hypothetical protein